MKVSFNFIRQFWDVGKNYYSVRSIQVSIQKGRKSKWLKFKAILNVELLLHVLCLDFLVMTLNRFLLKFFVLLHFFVVKFDHLAVSLCVDWGLTRRKLAAELLQLYNNFSLFILTCVLAQRLLLIKLLSSPPYTRFLVIQLN